MIFAVIFLPLSVAFPNIWNETAIWFYNIIPLTFLLDILMTTNTAMFVKGNIVNERKDIFSHYIKKEFWVDIISALPWWEIN
jgi:hypothetical protein